MVQMFGVVDQQQGTTASRQLPGKPAAARSGRDGPQMSGFSAVSLLPELPSRQSLGQPRASMEQVRV